MNSMPVRLTVPVTVFATAPRTKAQKWAPFRQSSCISNAHRSEAQMATYHILFQTRDAAERQERRVEWEERVLVNQAINAIHVWLRQSGNKVVQSARKIYYGRGIHVMEQIANHCCARWVVHKIAIACKGAVQQLVII